jgi:hypothetical protein
MELPPAPIPAFPPPPPGEARPRSSRGGLFVGVALLVVAAILLSLALFGTRALETSGSPHGAHAFLDRATDGTPYRWNPCQPIHYVVNPDHEPAGAEADLHEAIARLSAATGIRFVDEGTSVYTADQQIGSVFQEDIPGRPRYLPLLITFVTNQDFHFIVDTKQAIAFGMPYRGDGALAHEFVSGVVVIDVGPPIPAGFGSRFSMGPLLMHELGHVMGLAHVGAGNEIMWSPTVQPHDQPDPFQTDWGPGDLEGLGLLGRNAGCLAPR